MDKQPVITLDGLSYKDILKGVSLKINRGDIFAVMGPNGAGKTTLFEVLLGLRPGNHVLDLEAMKIGYLPEIIDFPHYLSVGEIFAIDTKIHEPCVEMVKFLDSELPLDIDKKRKISFLSKGERKKVALHIALRHNPDVLFLDEPTDGLDPKMRIILRKILKHLSSEGVTVIISSHVLTELERLANAFMILKKGRSVFCKYGTEDIPENCYKILIKDQRKIEPELKNLWGSNVTFNDSGFYVSDNALIPGIVEYLLKKNQFVGIENEANSFEKIYLRTEN